jgi:hypothetical protein
LHASRERNCDRLHLRDDAFAIARLAPIAPLDRPHLLGPGALTDGTRRGDRDFEVNVPAALGLRLGQHNLCLKIGG